MTRVISGPLDYCDSTKAEVLGLLMDLRELKSMCVRDCLIEGDS